MTRPTLFFCMLIIGMACTDSQLRTDVPKEPLPENSGFDSVIVETIQKLKCHNVLAIGEQHWNVEQHEFLKALISHPEFYAHVRHIVVEFGNALYQEAVTEYLNNVNSNATVIRKALTSGSQVRAWDGVVYENFFQTVREINTVVPGEKKIVVWLGEPPIDWSTIRNSKDFTRWYERNSRRAFMDSLKTALVSSGSKVLWIAGTSHVRRRGDGESSENGIYRTGIYNRETQPPLYTLLPTKRARLIDFVSDALFQNISSADGLIADGFDGYYYFKPYYELTTCQQMKELYNDAGFVTEINRRWTILRDSGMVD